MKRIFKQILTDKLAILIGSTMLLLFWTFVLSTQNPIIITHNPNGEIVVKRGTSFLLCRTVEYTRDVDLDISRALTAEPDEDDKIVVAPVIFPTVYVPRKKGLKNICRSVLIPDDTHPGKWDFRTYIVTYTPPWWRHSFELPMVKLRITK